jgi:hypothetical protein
MTMSIYLTISYMSLSEISGYLLPLNPKSNFQEMKYRILTILALMIISAGISSCAHHQYPASYHMGNSGKSRYY